MDEDYAKYKELPMKCVTCSLATIGSSRTALRLCLCLGSWWSNICSSRCSNMVSAYEHRLNKRYLLLSLLGRGGFSEVYKVQHGTSHITYIPHAHHMHTLSVYASTSFGAHSSIEIHITCGHFEASSVCNHTLSLFVAVSVL